MGITQAQKKSRAQGGGGQDITLNFDHLVTSRDYTGALALITTLRQAGDDAVKKEVRAGDVDLWIAYLQFHLGDYEASLKTLRAKREKVKKEEGSGHSDGDAKPHAASSASLSLSIAIVLYYLGKYEEAMIEAKASPQSSRKYRLLLHLSSKLNDDATVTEAFEYLQSKSDEVDNLLSIAAAHFDRYSFSEALDIYKRVLLSTKEAVAVNVFAALCYHLLEYQDVAQEILQQYMQHEKASLFSANLAACIISSERGGKEAERYLLDYLQKNDRTEVECGDLIGHNLAVFRGGSAGQIFVQLCPYMKEAKFNSCVFNLKRGKWADAEETMAQMQPFSAVELNLKGVVLAVAGIEGNRTDKLESAASVFEQIGGSPAEKDTVLGRLCASSALIIRKRAIDALVYMESVKDYCQGEEQFKYNYAITLMSAKRYRDAEDQLRQCHDKSITDSSGYIMMLARCCIMRKSAKDAWELYLTMETSDASFELLRLIASDCYRVASFFYSLKAYDVLERLDPTDEYWEGKRGAAVGVFQQVIAGRETGAVLIEVVSALRASRSDEAARIMKVIRKWAKQEGIEI
eukprot:CAMPEP_0113885446 /NCGR_PEP_ID=MMETSP0780_2-20120614/10916_1 /TAXON_ID=652834 /ORGANISM="Palpitomonas bilix" /LENGTH=574 /DNA_ID=CAMNT_0000873375 /DNA_START=380 /DNA_END=2104 /DNA_ORIENTATION=- /assembly_acc=CAM_ASM_000599